MAAAATQKTVLIVIRCVLQGKAVAKRVIVVTPSSLTRNWAAEVQKWLGSERCKALVMQAGPGAESQVLHSTPHTVSCYKEIVPVLCKLLTKVEQGQAGYIVCTHCMCKVAY